VEDQADWWVISTMKDKFPVFAIHVKSRYTASKEFKLYRVVSPEQAKIASINSPISAVDVSNELEIVATVYKDVRGISITLPGTRNLIFAGSFNARDFTITETYQPSRVANQPPSAKRRIVCEGLVKDGKRLVCVKPNQDNLLLFALLFIYDTPRALV